MKGPLLTPTLQDVIGKEPFHWRGDRDGIEEFNPLFVSLLGGDGEQEHAGQVGEEADVIQRLGADHGDLAALPVHAEGHAQVHQTGRPESAAWLPLTRAVQSPSLSSRHSPAPLRRTISPAWGGAGRLGLIGGSKLAPSFGGGEIPP